MRIVHIDAPAPDGDPGDEQAIPTIIDEPAAVTRAPAVDLGDPVTMQTRAWSAIIRAALGAPACFEPMLAVARYAGGVRVYLPSVDVPATAMERVLAAADRLVAWDPTDAGAVLRAEADRAVLAAAHAYSHGHADACDLHDAVFARSALLDRLGGGK